MLKNIFALVALSLVATICFGQHEIGEDLSRDLDGKTIAWEYSGGRNYEVRFEDGTVTYHRTNGDVAREWRSPVPYNARKVGADEYLVGWHEEDRSNYVTLLFQLGQDRLFSSALLGDYDTIHFQQGKINLVED
jgi:phenolic acid decarboxylase